MLDGLNQKVGQIVRNLLPLETAIVCLLLSVLVWPIPYVGTVSPSLTLICIYYWGIHRPDLLRPLAVFILGLSNDAINGLPVGLSALVFLGVHHLAFRHRRYFVGQPFSMMWFGFGVLSLMASFFSWSVLSFIDGRVFTILPVFIQYALTLALFPLPTWVMNRLQHVFLSAEDA